MLTTSAYFHIPFCRRRCTYCDFNTYSGMDNFIPAYVKAICQEMKCFFNVFKDDVFVHTIYFGGGTPSVLSSEYYSSIILKLKRYSQILEDAEISMEVNPGTVTFKFMSEIRKTGFNRLSIGMQSANKKELALLGRIHNVPEVLQTVRWARQAGFDNINLDLIFGVPDQTVKSWKRSLQFALDLYPEHLSLYSLTLGSGTPLSQAINNGLVSSINDDLSAEMYEWAINVLARNGYEHYEISNWARSDPDRSWRCKHNLQYWFNEPYIGFGAGAHSYYNQNRWENISAIPDYILAIERIEKDKSHKLHNQIKNISIGKKTAMQETMMLGLRLIQDGVDSLRFFDRFNHDMEREFQKEIAELINLGLVEWAGKEKIILRLTHRGMLMGNQVFMQFVD